ncbi:MAG TPA: ribulokinase [Psychromonas sp.]
MTNKIALNKYVIGLDFGSDSVRSLLVNTANGHEIASNVQPYKRWMQGLYCLPAESQFRHHPQDYIDSMTLAVQQMLQPIESEIIANIVGIGVDSTGSTPAPIDAQGNVLALLPEFSNNPNAMFILWKDHTSIEKAELINKLTHSGEFPDYTRYVGGVYSSEWFWAKAAWIAEQDQAVAQHAYSWVELCDWIPALISGNQAPDKLRRGICAAGHKALWHDDWDGLPSQDFLSAISPTLDGKREQMFTEVFSADQQAGLLSQEWADKFNLPEGIAVAIGEFDCHMGAVGAGGQAHDLVKVIGTSTCDILMVEPEKIGTKTIAGICGQVKGSALPGLVALEAGQSAFGDIFAWYKRLIMWPIAQWVAAHPEHQVIHDEIDQQILVMLSEAAMQRPPSLDAPLALDWHNGRRTPYANQRLQGVMSGINLGSDSTALFASLVESTAHGAKAIMDCMTDQGVNVNRIIAIGGIAQKSPLVMQTCADVMGRDIAVVKSEQCCALGAAIFAAVAAGVYNNTHAAQKAMASPISNIYHPVLKNHQFQQKRYDAYRELGSHVEAYTAS